MFFVSIIDRVQIVWFYLNLLRVNKIIVFASLLLERKTNTSGRKFGYSMLNFCVRSLWCIMQPVALRQECAGSGLNYLTLLCVISSYLFCEKKNMSRCNLLGMKLMKLNKIEVVNLSFYIQFVFVSLGTGMSRTRSLRSNKVAKWFIVPNAKYSRTNSSTIWWIMVI